MTTKKFSTDTKCPACGMEIYDAIVQILSQGDGGQFFEAACICGQELEIEYEPVPAFEIRKKEKRGKR